MNGPQGDDGIGLARNSIGHMSVGMQGPGVFRSTDNGQTRRELITGQLDPNKQRSREQSLHPFFNHDASGDIFAGIDFTADACCSTDNGDRWTVIHNALNNVQRYQRINSLMESRRFRGELTAMGFFVSPIGDNWFKPAHCFRSFLCRETKRRHFC
jgi:hypothetical protein